MQADLLALAHRAQRDARAEHRVAARRAVVEGLPAGGDGEGHLVQEILGGFHGFARRRDAFGEGIFRPVRLGGEGQHRKIAIRCGVDKGNIAGAHIARHHVLEAVKEVGRRPCGAGIYVKALLPAAVGEGGAAVRPRGHGQEAQQQHGGKQQREQLFLIHGSRPPAP